MYCLQYKLKLASATFLINLYSYVVEYQTDKKHHIYARHSPTTYSIILLSGNVDSLIFDWVACDNAK